MRIAVTGRDGQVATALAEIGPALGVTVVPAGRPDLDLARPETVLPALRAAEPEVVVSAAAYTAVDRAEDEPDLAQAVNGAGAGAVAEAAAALGVPVLHLSTDYVFDGSLDRPYREEDPVAPLGAYGRSKLDGERRVARATPAHVILRTAWVYAPFGANFVRTMLRLAGSRDEVGVVADQRGCPTSALDIARAVVAMAARLRDAGPEARAELCGTFHVAGRGEGSWAEVAEAVFARSAALGGPAAKVRRIATADYPTRAARPANSRLDTTKLARTYGLTLPDWGESLAECVTRLVG